MPRRELIISDLSGQEVDPALGAELRVLDHPASNGPVELDALAHEVASLASYNPNLVRVELRLPETGLRAMTVRLEDLNKIFTVGKPEAVIKAARPVQVAARPSASGRTKSAAPPKSEKVDYTAPDRFGQLHRGRITATEAKLVSINPGQASINRQAQGHPAIDWDDPAEQKRYDLDKR